MSCLSHLIFTPELGSQNAAVPPEVRINYIGIIDSILAESDLSRISEKKIRQGIQAKVEYDITPQKVSCKQVEAWPRVFSIEIIAGCDQRLDPRAIRHFQRTPTTRTTSSSGGV